MTTKTLANIVNQLEGSENEGFAEITPEEAEELAGGTLPDINGACGSGNNRGCPVSNTSCGPALAD